MLSSTVQSFYVVNSQVDQKIFLTGVAEYRRFTW